MTQTTASAHPSAITPTTAGSRPRRLRNTPLELPLPLWQLILGIVLLVAWQFASGRLVKELFISSPIKVSARLVEMFTTGYIWIHLQTTIIEFGVGYLIGAVAGIVLAVLLARTRFLADLLEPYIMAFYSIPKIAIAPLFIIWLGINLSPKIAIAAISALFLVFVNAYSGIRNINEEYVNLARIMGAKDRQLVWRILLPAAAPDILLGLRTSVPYAMIGAVIGEFIASSRGLGYVILQAAQLFDSASLFAGMLVLVGVVTTATQSLSWLERQVIRWRPVAETKVAI